MSEPYLPVPPPDDTPEPSSRPVCPFCGGLMRRDEVHYTKGIGSGATHTALVCDVHGAVEPRWEDASSVGDGDDSSDSNQEG